jgi:hypothetical protein
MKWGWFSMWMEFYTHINGFSLEVAFQVHGAQRATKQTLPFKSFAGEGVDATETSINSSI